MENRKILITVFSLTLLLATTVGITQAQGPGPGGGSLPRSPLGTAFTYQGRLMDGGNPADGLYDFRFALYDAEVSGSQIGSVLSLDDVQVTDGL